MAAIWAHLEATSAQVEIHMASKWGTKPAQSESPKTHVHRCLPSLFAIDDDDDDDDGDDDDDDDERDGGSHNLLEVQG